MKYEIVFDVKKGDFEKAGEASRKIKRTLQQLGIDNKIIRRLAIAGYEGEMNLVIHSLGGKISLDVREKELTMIIEDVGPGIPEINLAMTEGWTTAADHVRKMGFGAGMGLPNMKRNSDSFEISSVPDVGTKIIMRFLL